MSSRETLHISDVNFSDNNMRKRDGVHISVAMGFVLTLLAVLIAVVVGLIVHFAGSNRQVVCSCQSPPQTNGAASSQEAQWEACKELASKKGEALPCYSTVTTATPTMTSSPKPKVTDVRLPDTLIPIHYDLELKPDLYSNDPKKFRFSGKVKIHIQCKKRTNEIKLHINKLDIDNDSIKFGALDGGSAPKYLKWTHDKDRQFFIAHLDGALEPTRSYSLEIAFSGPLTNDLAGLYRSEYKTSAGTIRYIAVTQFAPVDARRMFPCFDEPEFRATFNLTVVRREPYTSISNMPLISNETSYIATSQFQPTDARKTFPCMDEPALKATFRTTILRKDPYTSLSNMNIVRNETRPDNWIADIYQTTPKMSTYLLAFVVSDFKCKEDNRKPVFRVCSRPEAIDQVDYALSIGGRILKYFERYFSIKFPLPKTDMIAIPDFAAGAMENWGLITYRETALLYDPKVSSSSNKQRVAVVVAHELAHQWFGNLVTPKWWDDLWLNEGFASYVEYLGTHYVEPGMRMMDQFLIEDLQDVMVTDSLSSSHPIYVPVGHPDEINEIFDRISYAKGASVIRMMNFFLGESTFKKGITNYLKEHEYGNAFHLELFAALTAAATADNVNVNVTDVMNTWILQMGYPVVTVTRDTVAKTASVTQRHFLVDPSQPPSDKYKSKYHYTWEVPFTMTTNATTPDWNQTNTDVIWMHKVNISLDTSKGVPKSPSDWIVANTGQYGFYRVNYDSQNWALIADQLRRAHTVIHVRNRAQIVDDAFNLARADHISVTQALQYSQYMENERELLPWSAYAGNLGYIDTMLSRTPIYGDFKEYMLKQVTPLYDFVKWTMKADDEHFTRRLRYIAIARACRFGHKPCLDKATKEFGGWMNTTTNQIHVDLKTIVYCYGIENGGVAEWDFAYRQYKQSNVASEKAKLLSAMSCSKEPWILNRYLLRALDETEIRKQDAVNVINSVAGNSIGEPLAWDFVRANWNTIMKSFGGGFMTIRRLIERCTRRMSSDRQFKELKEFKSTHPNLGSGSRAFDQAIEKTKANVNWVKKNEKKIGKWLKEALGKS